MRRGAVIGSLLLLGGLHIALAQASDAVIREGSEREQSTNPLLAEPEKNHYVGKLDLPMLPQDEDTFATYAYTFGDIVIFSYRDSNLCRVVNTAGDVEWSDTIMLDDYALVSGLAPKVYQILGNKEFSVLSGDPFNLGVCCWYAVDENSRPLSTKLLSVGPKNFSISQNVIAVFPYYDNTHVIIREIETGNTIWEGDLDSAEYYFQNKMYTPPIAFSVQATKPVSAGTFSGVVGTYAPAFNGTFTGRDFMTYYHVLNLDPQDMNIIPWEDNTTVVVTNLDNPQDTIWRVFCGKRGEVKGRSMPKDIAVYVHADKDISISQTPWASYGGPSNAIPAYLVRGIDRDGLGLGQEFFVPLIRSDLVQAGNPSRLHIIAYEDNTQVTLSRIPRFGGNETTIWQGTLNRGEFYRYTCPSNYEGYATYHVTSSEPVSTIGSHSGLQGSDFLPLWFAIHPDVNAYPSPQFRETECLVSTSLTDDGAYEVDVENNGNFWDVINIFTENSKAPDFTTDLSDEYGSILPDVDGDGNPDTDTLPKGGSFRVIADVTPGDMLAFGTTDTCFFTVVSDRDTQKVDIAFLVTRIDSVNIAVNPDTLVYEYPNATKVIPLRAYNSSHYREDTVNVTLDSPNKDRVYWPYWVTDEVFGDSLDDSNRDGIQDVEYVPIDSVPEGFQLRVTIPDTATAGDSIIVEVMGESVNYPFSVYPTVGDTATVVVKVEAVPLLRIEPNYHDTVPLGNTRYYLLEVENNGNGPDAPLITFTSNHSQGWSYQLYDRDTIPLSDTMDTIPRYMRDTIYLAVTPYSATVQPVWDTTIVRATSTVDPGVYDDAEIITVPSFVDLAIEPDTTDTIGPGESAEYILRVSNNGGAPDTVAIGSYAVPDLGWSYELTWPDESPLVDSDNDGIPDLGKVDTTKTVEVRLVVTPHEELGSIVGDFDTTVVETRYVWIRTGYADITADADDSVRIITVFEPPLDIHNYPNPFSGRTTFAYTIPGSGYVTLRIYNRAGEHICTLIEDDYYDRGGVFEIAWDGLTEAGHRPSPGVYIYSLQWRAEDAGRLFKTQKVVKKALMQP